MDLYYTCIEVDVHSWIFTDTPQKDTKKVTECLKERLRRGAKGNFRNAVLVSK